MAQLFFKYGAMNSSKSAQLMMTVHNYREQGKDVIIMTTALDDRAGKTGVVHSRIGLEEPAVAINRDTDVKQYVKEHRDNCNCVLIDEAQFLTHDQVLELTSVVDQLNIPVVTFGLKNDFENHLFEGSEALLIYADKIEEVKTICWFCNKKATMNLRILNGQPQYVGDQLQIGGNESYLPVCRYHYLHPDFKELKKAMLKND